MDDGQTAIGGANSLLQALKTAAAAQTGAADTDGVTPPAQAPRADSDDKGVTNNALGKSSNDVLGGASKPQTRQRLLKLSSCYRDANSRRTWEVIEGFGLGRRRARGSNWRRSSKLRRLLEASAISFMQVGQANALNLR